MKKILIFCLIAAAFAACNKGKFETVPQVKITSFGPDEVTIGQRFVLSAEITDKEGDLQDTFYLVRKRYTGTTLVPPTRSDSTFYSLTNLGFPTKDKIELRLTFSYGRPADGAITYGTQEQVDRGLTLGIIVRDKAKNKSTYVESNKIILKKL